MLWELASFSSAHKRRHGGAAGRPVVCKAYFALRGLDWGENSVVREKLNKDPCLA